MNELPKIGFIGTGVMGLSMAGHLLAAGYPLSVFNRTRERAGTLVSQGAAWCDSPGEVAASSDIIITIVGFPKDVESIYLDANGIVERAPSGSIFVDMTTSSPELAIRINEAAKRREIQSLDAPVSGGDIGAREARLSIMVGGDKAAFEKAKPLLDIMGANVVLQGAAGSGQHTKMCNQIAIASGMMAICESMAYAKASGLDPETVLKSISSGAAASWSLSNLAPRMLGEDFAPGFYVKHFIKDLHIALDSAEKLKLELPGLRLASELYEKLAGTGCEDDGTQALFKLYRSSQQ